MTQTGLDHAERYFQLALLGREGFVASVAPAALVRPRSGEDSKRPSLDVQNIYSEDTLLARLDTSGGDEESGGDKYEIYPLAKKHNAPFADMITIGRTANNDVVLKDITVSRFHSFFRQHPNLWIVCDAGSKNGTFLRGEQLEARKEQEVHSGDTVRIGDIITTFYTADDLYDVLRPHDAKTPTPGRPA